MATKRNSEYFIGIDSDGTVFDSMTIKHTHSFIPCMIDMWFSEEISQIVYEVAERINLYSEERGINRFPGLVRTFDEVKRAVGDKFPIENYESLRRFAESEYPMSNKGLEEYLAQHRDNLLEKVLEWSVRSDKVFSEKMKKQPPFEAAAATIKAIYTSTDLGIISSASKNGLEEDWSKWGLLEYMSFVAGQEFGGKDRQLEVALSSGYSRKKTLMIGDGTGDMVAAQKCGVFFYPIMPGHEEESWTEFYEIYFPKLIEGTYAQIQNELTDKFKSTFERV